MMGKATNFATFLKRMETGEFGSGPFGTVKTLPHMTFAVPTTLWAATALADRRQAGV